MITHTMDVAGVEHATHDAAISAVDDGDVVLESDLNWCVDHA